MGGECIIEGSLVILLFPKMRSNALPSFIGRPFSCRKKTLVIRKLNQTYDNTVETHFTVIRRAYGGRKSKSKQAHNKL